MMFLLRGSIRKDLAEPIKAEGHLVGIDAGLRVLDRERDDIKRAKALLDSCDKGAEGIIGTRCANRKRKRVDQRRVRECSSLVYILFPFVVYGACGREFGESHARTSRK